MAKKKSYRRHVGKHVSYEDLQTDRSMEYQKFFDQALQSDRSVIFFDGAAQATKWRGKYDVGWAYILMDRQEIYITGGRHIGTNNTGEQTALLKGLQHASDLGITEIDFYGDSAMILKQAGGLWGVAAEHLKDGYDETIDLVNGFSDVNAYWVPREQNEIADYFSKRVYEECEMDEEFDFDTNELWDNLPEEYL